MLASCIDLGGERRFWWGRGLGWMRDITFYISVGFLLLLIGCTGRQSLGELFLVFFPSLHLFALWVKLGKKVDRIYTPCDADWAMWHMCDSAKSTCDKTQWQLS